MSSIGDLALTKYLSLYLADPRLSPIRYFYNQLYSGYNPDITGYTLIFMEPPEFSSKDFSSTGTDISDIVTNFLSMMSLAPQTIKTLQDFGKIIPFMATDFTSPQTEVQNDQVQSRTGAISYATDVIETENLSISYIESNPLTIYKFHLMWIEYIRQILQGTIAPDDKYITLDSDMFGAQDYLSSFYIVKYSPDLMTINYISKCIGVYPSRLPSKELIGTRTTNEVCVLPFEYSCIAFREYVSGADVNKWILDELNEKIISKYKGLF